MNTVSDDYKNKLKDRIRSAKQRIKSKSSLEEAIESQENRLKRDIETRLNSREEWKQTLNKEFDSEITIKDISREESLDFFFKNEVLNIKSDLNIEQLEESKNQKVDEQVIDIEGSKDSKVLVKDMFTLETNWNLVERSEDVFISRKERIKEENNFLYFPSDKCPEENESLINEESKIFQKFNRLITKANLNRIKNRLTSEDLYNKFCDHDMKFVKNCERIEIKNSINYLPEFGSEKELICQHKSSVYSIREIFDRMFRGSDALLMNDSSAQENDDIEAKNLETMNADQLSQMLEEMRLKGSEQNESLMENIEDLKQTNDEPDVTNPVKSEVSAKELQFCSDEDIENNLRFKLLQLRWQGVPKFKNYKFVPLNEKEIPLDLFKTDHKIQSPLNTKEKFENKREKAIATLTKVGEQLIKQSSGTVDRPRTLEDMVIEEEMPGIT